MIIVTTFFVVSCGKNQESEAYVPIDEAAFKERETVNSINDGTIASDGTHIFMLGNAEGLIYKVDLDRKKLEVNCDDFMCNHEGDKCSAKLPISPVSIYSLRRNGNKVYVLGNRIFEIGNYSKKEIGHGKYGHFGNQVIFGNYIAYFKEQNVVVVENLENGREVQRFEGITGYLQGDFYYKDCLYYITPEWQLVRLDLMTGGKEILEEKGATRASVYDDFIYYIKISADSETNFLMRLNPDTLDKEALIEGVFYYNMSGDKLYYSSYPERQLCCSDMDGNNQRVINKKNGFGWLWAFDCSDKMIIDAMKNGTYYAMDATAIIDYKKPMIKRGYYED